MLLLLRFRTYLTVPTDGGLSGADDDELVASMRASRHARTEFATLATHYAVVRRHCCGLARVAARDRRETGAPPATVGGVRGRELRGGPTGRGRGVQGRGRGGGGESRPRALELFSRDR